MNGWAKCAGSLSILAGLVYFIAIILALTDSISLGDDSLAVFVYNRNFELFALMAGGILVLAGIFAIASGSRCKKSASPILGAMQIITGFVILVTTLNGFMEVTTLTSDAVDACYLIGFVLIAAALVILGIQKRVYSISVTSVILAYCVSVLYIFGTWEGMFSVLVGIVLVLFSGAALFIPSKNNHVVVEEEPVVEAEIVRAPASVAQPANAPLPRAVPEEKATPTEKIEPVPKAQPAPAAVAKPVPVPEPVKEEPKEEPVVEPVKEEVKPEPEPVKEEPVAEPIEEEAKPEPVAEKTESDILLEQGWNVAVASVGEDKAEEMDDYEIMATIREADPELYGKISAFTGIVVEPKAEPVPESVKEEPVAELVKEEAKPEPVAEKTEFDILLEQGWNAVVTNVGEERAEEMDDYEVMAVISVVDPELYRKLSILTGIVVESNVEEPVAEPVPAEEDDFDPSELGLEPDTPAGFLRRACWNKGLRCRKDYGPYYIPVAFVKSKVAVYIDGEVSDNRNDEELRSKSWVVFHFKESEITDGSAEAQIIYDAVKENTRALKKKKPKSGGKSKKR